MTRRVILFALLLGAACARQPHFIERSVTVGERVHRYRVWLPARYTKLHHWPVVLYLHDSVGRGDDNLGQLSSGLPPALERYGQRYKCIVVIPQCAEGHEWYGEMEQMALAELEQAIREFHGDRRRVYLTGLSMGGSGAWYFARHRRRFAAVVPISGSIVRREPFPTDPPPDIARIAYARDPYGTLAEEIGRTPVWAFGGAPETRNMVAALQRAGGNVRYTAVGDDRVYGDANVVHWMLAQKVR